MKELGLRLRRQCFPSKLNDLVCPEEPLGRANSAAPPNVRFREFRYLLQIEQQIASAARNPDDPTPPLVQEKTVIQLDQRPTTQNVDAASPSVAWNRPGTSYQHSNSISQNTSPAADRQEDVNNDRPDKIFSSNPLVKEVTYLRDPKGRYHFMGPTSTWSFFRRLVALIEHNVSQPTGSPSDPFNNDGTIFRIRWNAVPSDQHPRVDQLPPVDYSIFIFHTVKFRLGLYSHIIDEEGFLATLGQFETNPQEIAHRNRLWFAEYLLILAFGESYTTHAETTPTSTGAIYASRAMAVIPEIGQLHEEGLLAIEVLALAALWFHSVDMRVSAYQYIGQSLRLSYVEGIYRELPDATFGSKFTLRCKSLWWGVYILDRQLSAQMGAPSNIKDDEITMSLPWHNDDSTMAISLTLCIKLSRLLATITSTVYAVNDELGSSFIQNTKIAIKGLTEVAQESDQIMTPRNQNTAPSRVVSSITLMYHHCIMQATKPLMMCLMKEFIGPSNFDLDRTMITQPVDSLIKTAVASALTILKILTSLQKQHLIDSFLPFELEYAFSSAISLCILQLVLPEYITETSWKKFVDNLLDYMIDHGSVIASTRKHELYYLTRLLHGMPCRDTGPILDSNVSISGSVPPTLSPTEVSEPGSFINSEQHPATNWDQYLDLNTISLDPDPLFDLAMQFGIEP
ncbi:unnamed protein product [Clonostachys byssicola]|uniref:Xylanolytic transcriptional activator regulatory domain-containing protein n=1 Tax=Clonostachys byssicola TaxID=160290 RepID=A0A9N9Y3K7_9HYPO|nr:unnamed protein product [Clonostachys byssicola]